MSGKKDRIRVSLAFLTGMDADIYSRGEAVVKGMTGNTAYPQPPADLVALKTDLDSYSAAIAAALDGGKAAIANRQSHREGVSKTLRLLAHYVEAVANGDLNTVISSGFNSLNVVRGTAPRLLEVPFIRDIVHASSGQLVITISQVAGAASFELRYALQGAGGATGPWTSQPVTRVRPPCLVTGLTPGGTYDFQVRALGHLGFTDWSNTFTKMST